MADEEKLIVLGACCTWWDDIEKAGSSDQHPLPACPHCGNVLYQMPAASWWKAVDEHQERGHTNYHDFVAWLQGRKCYPDYHAAKRAYEVEMKTLLN